MREGKFGHENISGPGGGVQATSQSIEELFSRKSAGYPIPGRPVDQSTPVQPIQRLHSFPPMHRLRRPCIRPPQHRRVRRDRPTARLGQSACVAFPKRTLYVHLNELDARHVTAFTALSGWEGGTRDVLKRPTLSPVCARTLYTYHDHLHPIAHAILPHLRPGHHSSAQAVRTQQVGNGIVSEGEQWQAYIHVKSI